MTKPVDGERTSQLGKAGLRCPTAFRRNGNVKMNYGMFRHSPAPLRFSAVRSSGSAGMFADGNYNAGGKWYNNHVDIGTPPDKIHPSLSANILFFDLHAGNRKRSEFPADANDVFWSGL